MQKGAVRRPFFLLSISCTLFLKEAEGLSGTGRGMLWSKGPILRDSAPRFLRMRLVGVELGGAWRMLMNLASWMCRGAN